MPAETIKIRVDSWVDEDDGPKSHPSASRLRLRGSGSGHVRKAYMFFGRPFPIGASVLSGTLRLHIADSTWNASTNLIIKRITSEWKESEVRYAHRPNVDDATAITVAVPSSSEGTMREFNILPLMEDVANGENWHGLELWIGTDGHRAVFSSDSAAENYRPEVDLEWRKQPIAPLNLRPNEGAVSSAEPKLAWENYLLESDESQGWSQVQIDTTEDMASPIYDSGKASNFEPEWNTATVGSPDWGAGATVGPTYYWRVKVWNDADQESNWSDVASFTRIGKPTLTITSPPGSGIVEETTPMITWDVTGGTQESREVHITKLPIHEGRVGEAVSWDRELTAVEEVQVPNNFIRSGKSYRLEVKIWDTIDRAWSPGDPPFVKATRDFQYVSPGAIGPISNLEATTTLGDPRVVLTFDRAAGQPDFFCLKVDGVEVEDRIDASAASTGGISYTYTYWGAKPRVAQTYEVQAVTGTPKRHSHANDTDTATTNSTGIWLIDLDDGTFVRIIGPTTLNFDIRELGTTYDILAARSPVRITEHVGGYSGSFDGQIAGKAARDTFLDLKGRLKELWFIGGDLTFPVYLEEVSVNPSPDVAMDKLFPVEVACFQSGEFARTFEVTG